MDASFFVFLFVIISAIFSFIQKMTQNQAQQQSHKKGRSERQNQPQESKSASEMMAETKEIMVGQQQNNQQGSFSNKENVQQKIEQNHGVNEMNDNIGIDTDDVRKEQHTAQKKVILTKEKVREGLILSEILGPPRAKKPFHRK